MYSLYMYPICLDQDTRPAAHGPDPAPERVVSPHQDKMYKKLLVNDGVFMNEFKIFRLLTILQLITSRHSS